MEKEQIKYELINRYKYIYENAVYILAPYMYQQNKNNSELIYLRELPSDLLLNLESFLLSDIPFNQSKLYIELEEEKDNLVFLSKVKNGLELLEKENKQHANILQTKLDSWKLFVKVREFINEQSSDLKNKEKKLTALDEYFRINRYQNDGKIWTSGYSINIKDMNYFSSLSITLPKNERKPGREKNDVGLKKVLLLII